MKVESSKAYSIAKIVDHNIVFSKEGTIAYLFYLNQPERYQLSEERFDNRLLEFFSAFQSLPQDCYIHKQDVYLEKDFDPQKIDGDMYLDNAMKKHFLHRKGNTHYCILAFVITGLKSLEKSYLQNPFKYKEKLVLEDKNKIITFENAVDRAFQIINNIYKTKLIPLTEEESKNHIKNYVNGFEGSGFYDIDFEGRELGESHFDVFSFSESEYFPKGLRNVKKDPISKDDFIVKQGVMDDIAETFLGNHIYNQIFYFQGSKVIQNQIDLAKEEYGKLRSMSTKIDEKYLQLDSFLKDSNKQSSDTIFIKTHCNLILFDRDKEKLLRMKEMAKSILDASSIDFHIPKKEVLKNIFLGSIIGRENKLHPDCFFISHLKESLCYYSNTTIQRDDKEGIFFNDRINNLPLRKDIWDEKRKRMYARNGIIIANTGGGKSVTALNIITQFLSQKINVVVAEFGRSFQFITELYPEISSHVSYNPTQPLGLNPFLKKENEQLSPEKISLLRSIILKVWRVEHVYDDSHVSTSINRLLKNYYEKNKTSHSFEDFYYYVINGGKELLKDLEIEEQYFDLKSFKHNTSEFITGGIYENVFKISEEGVALEIKTKQFVVFELTEVKKDPFLVTLILLILQETIDSNILSDRSKKGILIFDEFAESQAIKDIYSSESVLQTVATLYQKIRKENGAVYIIIQDPSQLPKNEYTEGIIANSQVLIVLPSKKVTYLKIQETFKLEDHEFEMLQTLKNNTEEGAKYKYSEQWIKLGEESLITRLELSKEAFLAFQTDGEVWSRLNELKSETKSLQKAIEITIKN